MNKSIYETPNVEKIDLKFEAGIMGMSGGEGTAGAEKMNSGSWDAWEE